MPKVSLYNREGNTAGEMELSDVVFGVKPKKSLIHQVYVALRANAREPWADAKKRGEVRGGGKKPWKQKGTGRARHGSIRSPIWKGGGVAFGPLSERNYTQKINKKMNKEAVRMCLSDKVKDKKFIVVDDFGTDGKTKAMAAFRKAVCKTERTTLFLVPEANESVMRSTRNLQRVTTERAQDVNVVDLMHHQYVIISKDGIKVLEQRLAR